MRGKKILVWTGAAVAGLILIAGSAGLLIQQNTFLHRYILVRVIQAAEKSTGTTITMRDFGIDWIPLRVTLTGVTVRDRGSDSAAPLADLPETEIGVSWRALFHKRVDLTEVIVNRPAVNLRTDSAGETNLPTASRKNSSGSKFQVTVQRVAVRGGEVRYNNVQSKIDAELADFHADIDHKPAVNRYSGSLGYSRGVISFEDHAPLRHDLQIKFLAGRDGIDFERVHIETASSQLNAKGSVQGFANPKVHAEYEVLLSPADLRRELPAAPLSGDEIKLAGSLSYDLAAGSGLEAFKTDGHISGSALMAAVSSAEVNLRSVAGDYSLDAGNLHVTRLRAQALGGILRGEFSAEHLTSAPSYQFSVSSNSLSLTQAREIAGAGAVPLRGTARVEARGHWVGNINRLVAQADATISAEVDARKYSGGAPKSAGLPVNAELHLGYDAPKSTLSVTHSTFSSGKTNIVADGTISDHSALSVTARSSDLRETDLLITTMGSILSSTANSSAPKPLNLNGTASLEAMIQGRIQNPRITGHAAADGLEIRQAKWPHIQADFDASASSASVKNGVAQSANRGRLNFAAATSLRHWSYSAEEPVSLQLQASQIPLGDLEELTGFSEPVSGILSANISATGTIDNPTGQGSIELRDASLWGEPVRNIAAQLHTTNKIISANFSIASAAGNITGKGEFSASDRNYQIAINHSVLNLSQIQYLSARGYNIGGTLAIDAHGQGTLASPQLAADLAGKQLAFRNAALGSIDARIEMANRQVEFTATSNIAGGQINANGNAGLSAPYMMKGAFEVRSLQFGPLLAAYAPSLASQLKGGTEIRGQMEGPLSNPAEMKANLELSSVNLAYRDVTLASAGPVRLNYAGELLTISQAELKGTGTDFKFGGSLPLGGSAPVNITTNGTIDLRVLDVLGANTQSSGTVKLDMSARGALKQPQIGGTVELANASFVSDAAPVGVDKVNARIAVANNRLTIENLSGEMGGGSFSVSGFASYAPVSYSLQVNGKSVRVRYPQGTRSQLDAGLTLTGTAAGSSLNGRVTIDQLSFTPDFDLANFVGQFISSTPSTPSKWEQNARLDVIVASSNVLALSSSQLSLQGSTNLRVAGTLANPVVLGRTTLTGGSLIFMGNVYQVQNGTIIFANPVRTEPTLNIYVTTFVEQYNITLNFVGTLDRLRTNYTSDPALPSVDIIHLLAFGKTTAESAATATPASQGAESLIANQVAGQVSSRIEKLTGISQLQIDPSLGSTNSNPGARLAVQQRVTSNVLFTFATDLTDTQNEVVQVEYQTRGKLSFSLTRDEYGSYAIQVKTHKTF